MAINVSFYNYSEATLNLVNSLYQAGGATGAFGITTWQVAQGAGQALAAGAGEQSIIVNDREDTVIAQQNTWVRCVWIDPTSEIQIGVDVQFPGSVLDGLIQPSPPTWSSFYGTTDASNVANWNNQGSSVSPINAGGGANGSPGFDVMFTPNYGESQELFTVTVLIQSAASPASPP